MQIGREMRRWPRRPIDVRVICGNEGAWFHALMRDIAGGGIGIKAKQILPPGSKVFVKVSDMTSCMAEATVVWARDVPFSILSAYKFRMGVKLRSTTSNFNEFLKTKIT